MMSATLVDFTDLAIPLPSFLLIDTSVLLNALRPDVGAPIYHDDAKEFLKRLEGEAIAGRTIPLITLPVLEECVFKILQSKFAAEAKNRGLPPGQWHQVYKHNPELIESQFYSEIQQFRNALSGIPVLTVEPEDLSTAKAGAAALNETMCLYIESFHLLPQDALNLAIANRLNVNDVVAIDADLHRADGFTIYTCLV